MLPASGREYVPAAQGWVASCLHALAVDAGAAAMIAAPSRPTCRARWSASRTRWPASRSCWRRAFRPRDIGLPHRGVDDDAEEGGRQLEDLLLLD